MALSVSLSSCSTYMLTLNERDCYNVAVYYHGTRHKALSSAAEYARCM